MWRRYFIALMLMTSVLTPQLATASNYWELSWGFFFHRRNYSDPSYMWLRRWNGSVAYQFWGRSGVEFSYQDIYERTYIQHYEDTYIHDRLFSLSWIQSLAPEQFPVQPFVKAGLGQLYREAGGQYLALGVSPPSVKNSLTIVLGAGFRVYLIERLAIRVEATTYLDGGSIATFRDNVTMGFGTSAFF